MKGGGGGLSINLYEQYTNQSFETAILVKFELKAKKKVYFTENEARILFLLRHFGFACYLAVARSGLPHLIILVHAF